MDNTVFYIVLCFLLPIIMLCLYLEKRARRIMISFCFGVLACLFAYNINNLLLKALNIKSSTYAVFVGPFVEEFFKFLPILVIAFVVNKGKRGSTANAYSVGIGFCLVENIFYLMKEMYSANAVWIVSRSIGTGLMHGMSATIMGLGIFMSRTKKKTPVFMIVCTYFISVIYHGLYNFLIEENVILRIFGVLLPILTYLSIFVFVKKENIKNFLNEEGKQDSDTSKS